jgi:hypothetical protein
MTIIGLILIALAWVIQIRATFDNIHTIQPLFVKAYALGVLLITITAFREGEMWVAILNLAVVLMATAIMGKNSRAHRA